MNVPSFEGKKWRRPTEYTIKVDCFDYETKTPVFKMTKAYAKYLTEKEKLKKQHELLVLKNKLDYQMSTYNEVDEVDYNLYVHLLTESMSTTSKPTSKLSRTVVINSQQ